MKNTHRERIQILISFFPLPPILGMAGTIHWPKPNEIKRTPEPIDMMDIGQPLGRESRKGCEVDGKGHPEDVSTPTTLR